jgi:ABC-2 type transport system ATP-binding protein
MNAAINVENLVVRYRSKKGQWLDAVQNLSFQVEPGEIVGFLGPNGAGKSSTLKSLMGFVVPHQGKCEVFGLEAGSLAAKKRVGYLPEVALYYPFLTPLETLKLYGELQGLRGQSLRREALELLALVGLETALHKQNRSLSKGMLQRVGIAQALLGSPQLLVLDEVTSGLDPVGRKELRNLLIDRQKQGATLFFSSHELSEVDMLCDRILLIDKGRLIEERDMSKLRDDLRNFSIEYVRQFTEPHITERFATKDELVAAIARLHQEGCTLIDVTSQEGSLEDYFINTIGRAA